MKIKILESIKSDSTLNQINDYNQQIQEFNPDWIIALGGGSVIDTAKALWLLFENPDIDIFNDYQKAEELSVGNKASLCVIPTGVILDLIFVKEYLDI